MSGFHFTKEKLQFFALTNPPRQDWLRHLFLNLPLILFFIFLYFESLILIEGRLIYENSDARLCINPPLVFLIK